MSDNKIASWPKCMLVLRSKIKVEENSQNSGKLRPIRDDEEEPKEEGTRFVVTEIRYDGAHYPRLPSNPNSVTSCRKCFKWRPYFHGQVTARNFQNFLVGIQNNFTHYGV